MDAVTCVMGVELTEGPTGTLSLSGKLGLALGRGCLFRKVSCPSCKDTTGGSCTVCHRLLTEADASGSGYQGNVAHHYHLEQAGDRFGIQEIMPTLCAACYREDFATIYPGVACPV